MDPQIAAVGPGFFTPMQSWWQRYVRPARSGGGEQNPAEGSFPLSGVLFHDDGSATLVSYESDAEGWHDTGHAVPGVFGNRPCRY